VRPATATGGPETRPRKMAVALGGGLTSAAAGSGVPFVTASGKGLLAEEIIQLAGRHGVPVEHDPALATVLAGLEIGQLIPPELYQAIAELLVFLYDLEDYLSNE
jgi:flagellar biosynthesis protein